MRRVGLYTLGCKVSQYETEAIAESFEKQGYIVAPFDEANDIYVINTCTVTAEADKKSRQIIRRAKRNNPNAKVIVCGCYSQRSPEEVYAVKEADAVIGSANKMHIVDIAEKLLSSGERFINVTDIESEPFEQMQITKGPRTRVYVKIEDGCESKCTYCAIPSARGNVRSKAKDDVINEVETLRNGGTKEVVLTGIETGSYGADFNTDYRLADLIYELDQRKSIERIRLGSLAPELVGEKFVKRVKDCKILAPHFHLSIQSGSNNVLMRMKRRYNRNMALENINRLRENIKGVCFTTDIMVGFPGESESDFLDTVSFVKEAEFLDAHIFCYSKRKNTPAAEYKDQIPEIIKKERSEYLMKVVREVKCEVLNKIVSSGSILNCIFEERRGKYLFGHSQNFAEVIVECESDLIGEAIDVSPISHDGEKILAKII